MAVAATLLDAANIAQSNLFPLWMADTLKAKVIAFWTAISPSFLESVPNDRPIGDWIAVIAAFAPSIQDFDNRPPTNDFGVGTEATFQRAITYVYRLCKFAFYYNDAGLITNAQAAVILAAYNAQFA